MSTKLSNALAFSCPRGPLLKAVQLCAKIVERRNTIPILSNVALRVGEDGSLSLTSTDLDLQATVRLPARTAEVKEAGEITVPATLLADLLRKMGEGADVALADDGKGRVTLKSGRSVFKLHALPIADFPEIKVEATPAEFELSGATLRRIKDEVAFAISMEETRYYLNGVFLHAADTDEGPMLTAIATDGHRLSRSRIQPYAGAAAMPAIIIPRKTVGLIDLLADAVDADETITVRASDTKIVFEAGRLQIVSKLIDGTFPDYNRVIPRNNPKRFSLLRAGLAAAIDRVQTISIERGRAAKFVFGEGTLAVSVQSPDAGEATDEIACEAESEEAEGGIEIGFNARYALDILSSLSGDTVVFGLADPGSPSLITDPADDRRTIVLMPMRV